MTSSAKGDADRQCLAARFVEGPRLFAPAEAQQRLAGWLGDLAPEQASAIRGSCRPVSASQNHPRRHRRSLVLSVRSDARRCRAADPAARLRSGLASRRSDRANRARRGRSGRRSRGDAPAPAHEVGSSAVDRAVRYRRGLAGDARHRRPDRSRGGLGAVGAALSAAAGSRTRPADRRRMPLLPKTAAASSCSRWARWARAS